MTADKYPRIRPVSMSKGEPVRLHLVIQGSIVIVRINECRAHPHRSTGLFGRSTALARGAYS